MGRPVARVAEVLAVEEFAQLRADGWSYERIAGMVEFSITAVNDYGRKVLPAELRKRVRPVGGQCSPVGERVVALLEAGWEERGTAKIAAEVGCHRTTVRMWKRKWLADREDGRGRKRCVWCGILGEDVNPIGEEGLCLWCRVEAAGWRVIDWLAEGGMVGLLDG